jgi:hypothetical protein
VGDLLTAEELGPCGRRDAHSRRARSATMWGYSRLAL